MSLWTSNSMLMTEKLINYLWDKQEVSSNNITNIETPGFKGSYLTFEDEMRNRIDKLKKKDAGSIREAIEDVTPTLRFTENEAKRLDGNNVDIVAEHAEMAKSGIQYQYAVRAIGDDFIRLRTAIKGT